MSGIGWKRIKWLYLTLAPLAAACETLTPGDPGNLVPRTVAEDPSLPAIDMNGSRFHLETFGNPANPAIVVLHGGPGGDYRGLLRLAARWNGYSLTDEYFMIFWDQRGTGLSRRESRARLNEAIYVADLDSLIERYSPGRPVLLLGESWGAMYATRYINEFPQKVAGAVLIEPGPLDGATMDRLRDDIVTVDIGSEFLNDWAWNTQFFTPDDHARMDYIRTQGVAGGAQPRYNESQTDPSPNWRQGAAANAWLTDDVMDKSGKFVYDFTTNLAAFTAPVLFLAGSRSEIQGASLQELQVQRFPSATLHVITGAGHDVAWVKAAETVTHIRAYLDALRAGGTN
jgi:proline iminopeptidase